MYGFLDLHQESTMTRTIDIRTEDYSYNQIGRRRVFTSLSAIIITHYTLKNFMIRIINTLYFRFFNWNRKRIVYAIYIKYTSNKT